MIQANIDESYVKIHLDCLVMAPSQRRLESVSPSARLQWSNASVQVTLGVKRLFRIFVRSDDLKWMEEVFRLPSTS